MANGWTPERRARQAELIRKWRPWEQSTGPKTEAGKAEVSQNPYKGGAWRLLRELSRALREHKKALLETKMRINAGQIEDQCGFSFPKDDP